MAILTQCPHCATAFNVTPDQLFARDGRVRCGNCRQVFDGLVHLTSLEALEAGTRQPTAPVKPTLTPEVTPMPQALPIEPVQAVVSSSVPDVLSVDEAPLPAVPQVPVPPLPIPAETAPQPTLTPTMAASDAPAVREAQREAHAGPIAAVDAVPALADEVPVRRLWPWAIAASLAALLLAGQALYGFRSEVAAHFPHLKAPLVRLCELASCAVPPLQKPAALAIQASDLLIIDKMKPNLVQLIVTLENQSNLEIGYPAIDLVLNDRFDHAVARRVFLPKEYLLGADAQKTAIAASGTTTLRLNLDISELSADGFRVLLIPAPPT